MQLRRYLRVNLKVYGVLIAEDRGDNVFVGYSVIHPKDMDDKIWQYGLTRAQRKDAVKLALEKNVFDIESKDLPRLVLPELPHFLNRCGNFYRSAKTINGFDIAPYRSKTFIEQNPDVEKILLDTADNMQDAVNGILRVIDFLRENAKPRKEIDLFKVISVAGISEYIFRDMLAHSMNSLKLRIPKDRVDEYSERAEKEIHLKNFFPESLKYIEDKENEAKMEEIQRRMSGNASLAALSKLLNIKPQ